MTANKSEIKMRRYFADIMHKKMAQNNNIWVITSDLGYKMWDRIREDYPDRFINVGAAEQVMTGIGIGLALKNKIPFLYTITPFLLYRPFETIRNYINNEKIPVKLVGSGRNQDYIQDGFSHWAAEDRAALKIFGNINTKWPENNDELPAIIDELIKNKIPYYLNLKK